MILASVLLSLSVFLSILFAINTFGPEGEKNKSQHVEARIFGYDKKKVSYLGKNGLFNRLNLKILDRLMTRYSWSKEVQLQLKRSGISLSISSLFLLCFCVSALTALILKSILPWFICIIASIAVMLIPFIILKSLNRRYLWKFIEIFPDALSVISNSIKVGHSLETGINAVARSKLGAVSQEFTTIQAELKLGLPIQTALKHLDDRLKCAETRIFVTGVGIHQEVGGNLGELLDNLEKTIRDRFVLKREIKALSAQGVMSCYVLICMPFVVFGLWSSIDPNLVRDWLATGGGKVLLLMGISFIVVAYFLMKMVTNLEAIE